MSNKGVEIDTLGQQRSTPIFSIKPLHPECFALTVTLEWACGGFINWLVFRRGRGNILWDTSRSCRNAWDNLASILTVNVALHVLLGKYGRCWKVLVRRLRPIWQ